MQPGLLLAAIWVASSSSSGELRATAAPAAHGTALCVEIHAQLGETFTALTFFSPVCPVFRLLI